MPGHLFVIVEMTADDMPLSSFTLRNPGTAVDIISEPVAVEGDDRYHPSLVMVKGAPADALNVLLRQLGRVYDHIEAIERDDLRRLWLGRMRLHESAYLHNRGARVLSSFQHRYGAPWTHLEAGTLHLRARVQDEEQGELLADQMRRYFGKEGVDAQVELREISGKDYGVWEELVQHAIGLAP